MELRYTGNHQPTGMIIDVEESKVDDLVESGEYELINSPKIIKKEKKEVVKDDSLE
jgi:hypothetical protein